MTAEKRCSPKMNAEEVERGRESKSRREGKGNSASCMRGGERDL